jgi:hypothetical protein
MAIAAIGEGNPNRDYCGARLNIASYLVVWTSCWSQSRRRRDNGDVFQQ